MSGKTRPVPSRLTKQNIYIVFVSNLASPVSILKVLGSGYEWMIQTLRQVQVECAFPQLASCLHDKCRVRWPGYSVGLRYSMKVCMVSVRDSSSWLGIRDTVLLTAALRGELPCSSSLMQRAPHDSTTPQKIEK